MMKMKKKKRSKKESLFIGVNLNNEIFYNAHNNIVIIDAFDTFYNYIFLFFKEK